MVKKENTVAVIASVAVGLVALLALSIIWSALWFGLSLSILWGWFVVPLFGLPSIGVAQSYGLILVLRLMTINASIKKESETKTADLIARSILTPPFSAGVFICVGWLVKAWT